MFLLRIKTSFELWQRYTHKKLNKITFEHVLNTVFEYVKRKHTHTQTYVCQPENYD